MKKLLLLVPVIALLAAGCGSSSSEPSSTPSTSQNVNQPANSSVPGQSAPASTAPSGSTWQATLMVSNNTTKGNYMITVSGHTVYLNTSRDYSALVGKPVNVIYTGDINSFSLQDITAQ